MRRRGAGRLWPGRGASGPATGPTGFGGEVGLGAHVALADRSRGAAGRVRLRPDVSDAREVGGSRVSGGGEGEFRRGFYI